MKYYGKKNNAQDYGFYEENFENAIEISDRYWEYLIMEQNEGKRIILFNNEVIAVDENEYSFENGVWQKLSSQDAELKRRRAENSIRIRQIEKELSELDNKRIRAIAEPSMKDAETTWLEFYNQQIQTLRQELQQLNN